MSTNTVTADYLVVGTGAMGMAFTDTLLAETDATVALVDRYHAPGGHWNTAYPFVRLHQPSAFYGVNSRALGSDTIDAVGWNEGLYELATSGEVCAYFDQVMQQQFLPSGRVQYFPLSEHGADGFRSLVSGRSFRVDAATTVDATYMHVTVPSMRPPPYPVADGVACVAPNELPKAGGRYERFMVIGAGKTGMDACLFLLRNGVAPDAIRWVMPRDSWLLDRANIQPGKLFAGSIGKAFAQQAQDIAEAVSVEDLFARMESTGQLLRFDPEVTPSMYRCATVTRAELDALRSIRGVIRKGRVQALEAGVVQLDEGSEPTDAGTLHIDCTADGLERRPTVPVFQNNAITLQSVRTCQQVFSAAFIGHVEASFEDEGEKNALCTPVPHPDSALDFLRTNLANNLNGARWAAYPALQRWLKAARLDGFTASDAPDPDPADPATQALGARLEAATENLQRLIASA